MTGMKGDHVSSPRLEEAVVFATRLHRVQKLKGTAVSYISDLLAVAALVLEHGGSEDEAIAILLHDAGKGKEGGSNLDDIRIPFGDTVAGLVAECSDDLKTSTLLWRERKELAIAAISGKSPAARLILASFSLHNATAILGDFQKNGASIWGDYEGGREGILWYFENFAISLCSCGQSNLGSDLLRVVSELKRLTGLSAPKPPQGARDFSEQFYKLIFYCPCGHSWKRENEHVWWDTQTGPSDAEIAASKRAGDDCPQCGKPVPPTACPDCGGAVSVEAANLRRSALEDWAYEEEDFLIRCADGHAFLYAHRFGGER